MACLAAALALGGCHPIHRGITLPAVELKPDDRTDLERGDLSALRARYEDRKLYDLNDAELAVLCDIYVRHVAISEALECLSRLERREAEGAPAVSPEKIAAKRALIALLTGQAERAAMLTRGLSDDGAAYVHALARERLGDEGPARDLADRWSYSFKEEEKFLGANLYLVTAQYEKALETVDDPEPPRLSRDYSLTGGRGIFGIQIEPTPLRVDLFDEFGYGLLDTFSYAPPANVYVEFIIAKAQLERGELDDARRRLDAIIGYPPIGAFRDVQWLALFERGRAAELLGHPAEGVGFYKRAIEVIESMRASISTEAGRIGFVGDKQEVYGHLIELLLEQNDLDEAFEYVERARSRALVDLLAQQAKFGRRPGTSPRTDELIRKLRQAENRLREAPMYVGRVAPEIERRVRSIEELRRLLREEAPEVASLVEVAEVSRVEIESRLNQNQTLVQYYYTGFRWHAFVLRDGVLTRIGLDAAESIAELVDAFRAAISQRDGSRADELGRRLYRALIAPLEPHLSGHLIIVPHGPLHYLPFAALRSEDGFLIERYTIQLLPSAEVIRFLDAVGAIRSAALTVGDPLGDLVYARREALAVADIHGPGSIPLVQDTATRANFVELAPSHRILHIASHGEFVPEDPLASRLLLGPSATDDGSLSVADLFALEPPLNADVAVLSACETALSKIADGDDLVGLQRGFLYAGSSSMIGSLWRVEDEATMELMVALHEGLERGLIPPEALRAAQLAVKGRFAHPYYWASFTFTGATA